MIYFKDTSNKLHFIDSEQFVHLLPPDAVQITEAEANAIRAAQNASQPTVDAARAAMLVRIRADREVMLNRLNGLFNTEIADNGGVITPYATEIVSIVKQLRDITKHPLVLARMQYPSTDIELYAATNAAYQAIVSPASNRLKLAFQAARL
ncbi:MAG: hypothetical protein E6Q97_29325 [Desulfurellales bacterium]|nr:MAG: hypothetical protein E6Q97_29325 [Desulfurellales bacterium]